MIKENHRRPLCMSKHLPMSFRMTRFPVFASLASLPSDALLSKLLVRPFTAADAVGRAVKCLQKIESDN